MDKAMTNQRVDAKGSILMTTFYYVRVAVQECHLGC